MKLEELVGKPITEAQFDEAAGKKDACYRKVKARYDVWPSAYASGALVKCRKVGAKNWGNKSKKESKNEMKRMGAYARVLKKLKDKEKKNKSKKEGLDDLKALPKDLKKSIKKNREEGKKYRRGRYVDEKVLGGKDVTSGIDKNTKITFDKRIPNKKLAGKTFVVVKKGINTFNVRPDGSGNERDTKKLDAPTILQLLKNKTIRKIVNSKGKKLNKESVKEGDIESRELKLYIDNDSQLYNSRFMPIMKNLTKKMKKGNFDKKLAIKGFMILVDAGAKKYVKDFGGNAKDMFSKKDRIAVASDLADEFEDAYKNKEYSFMENVNESRANVLKAIKIAKKMSGNMTGAVKKIEKIQKGLSKQIEVEDALRQANEGLGDMVGKSIGKYNKKRKKNMDALKKLKKKESVEEGFASNAQRKAAFASGYKAKGKKKKKESVEEARGTCWVGYQQKGMKDKGGRMVPNCVKEIVEVFYEENGEGHGYTFEYVRENQLDSRTGKLDKKIRTIKSKEDLDDQDRKNIKDLMKMKNRKESVNEAEYQGRKVKLGKIMQGDTKKFKVYVKNPKGNVVKVNFGQGGGAKGGTMRIRKSNAAARKSFRARHNCDNPGPRHKARYWSCRKW